MSMGAAGVGSSAETAVIVQWLRSEYAWLQQHHPGCTVVSHKEILEGERLYDILTIESPLLLYFQPVRHNPAQEPRIRRASSVPRKPDADVAHLPAADAADHRVTPSAQSFPSVPLSVKICIYCAVD